MNEPQSSHHRYHDQENEMTLLITGASGKLGRRTAELVLERHDRPELILVTRRPDAIADLAQHGAIVRSGDFADPASLPSAFAGADHMLLISTDALGEERVASHRAAIDAARQVGVHHVAYTSFINPTAANPAAIVPDHRATEDYLAASGLEWTFLRSAQWADWQIPDGEPDRFPECSVLETGVLRHNRGDGKVAYVSREDFAAAAAAVLTGGAEHAGRAYDITGPELIGGSQLAELYARTGGRPVVTQPVSDAQFIEGLVAAGVPEFVAEVIASFGAATRLGALEVVSTAVADLTGRPATTVSAVFEGALTPVGA
jgi:NAD(P)H dehydrogenase (quinone)